ncbi:MAG: BlaI/MecI/CopY family transcriptional regulator [Planctomycetota bacterium]|jgi:predicted transcriptional regulator
MTRKAIEELGELQRETIEALWQLQEATVREIRDALGARGRNLAYTTVLSVLQKLGKSGWVSHRKRGRAHVFRPANSRSEESGRSVKRLVKQVFRGDPVALFEHLVEDETIGDEELARLRRMIDRRRKELGDG